jgi:hypothetical protein
MTTTILTNDQLRHSVPSVFATQPWHRMSERYRHVPTIEVVNMLRDRGFHPVKAMQSRSRIEGKEAFTKHMLRFRHADFLSPVAVGTDLPEVILTNSHDGSAAYRLMAGIFRLVCSNGMIVASADFGSISVKHAGGADFRSRILDATFRIAEETPRAIERIETWKGIELSQPQREAFATAALTLKDSATITAPQLLAPRRDEDKSPDLWTTTNVIQGHLVQGGDEGRSARGRRTRTRPIKSVDADIRTNRALWVLAEEMAKLARA